MSGIMQLLLASRPQAVPDPYFEYTTLLLPGNGTNGAQNNTFLDSSTNAFSITRNGNTTQGTFSPFSQTGWGNYFDGNGDSLQVANNVALRFGTGDFTVEAWVYLTALPSGTNVAQIVGTQWSGFSAAGAWTLWLRGTSNKIEFCVWNTILLTSASPLTANQWYHVAVTRSGTSTKLFINGTNEATATSSFDYNNASYPTIIGRYDDTGSGLEYLTGYISNVRLVKGTAVYTSNFTPSTTPLTAITNTSLLTCQSNRFIDNSTNNFTITRNGDVSVQAFSPFNPTAAWSAATNGGSGYFDGSGDYLATPSNSALNLSGDFTVEAWVYPTSLVGARQIVTTRASAATATSTAWSLAFSGTSLIWFTTTTNISGGTAIANAWNYVAAVRSGSTITLYLNGSSVGTATLANNFTDQTLYVGACGNGNEPIVGYISGTRVLKGTAATITVPTAPPTAITNTSLLLNYTNAGIYDATSKNDLETVGNAQISTTQSKFGGSSMYFDGSGDTVICPPSVNLALGSGQFTVEFWMYWNAVTNINEFVCFTTTGNSGCFTLYYTGGSLQAVATGGAGATTASWSPSTGQWYHVAVTRDSSNNQRIFIDGVQLATAVSTNNYGQNGFTMSLGATFNGYIDDLRITKGYARYTANFTPPTAAFPLF